MPAAFLPTDPSCITSKRRLLTQASQILETYIYFCSVQEPPYLTKEVQPSVQAFSFIYYLLQIQTWQQRTCYKSSNPTLLHLLCSYSLCRVLALSVLQNQHYIKEFRHLINWNHESFQDKVALKFLTEII